MFNLDIDQPLAKSLKTMTFCFDRIENCPLGSQKNEVTISLIMGIENYMAYAKNMHIFNMKTGDGTLASHKSLLGMRVEIVYGIVVIC